MKRLILLTLSGILTFSSQLMANEGVETYGQLQIQESQLTDSAGMAVQLQGMSLFWSQWEPKYYTKETLQWLQEDWCINVIRAAMAIESNGYLKYPEREEEKIRTVVEAAIDLDLYVIIDWHDHHAEQHQAEAIDFFARMAQDYGQYPNVIYEIFNEPIEQDWDTVIKPYSEAVVDTIRAIDPDNIIICGSSNWSQDLHKVADNPIVGYDNIAYTLHYYAGTHGAWLRDRADDAIAAGIPVFVTEYGTVDADGDGAINKGQSFAWWDWMEENSISHCNWSVSDKNEGASIVFESASADGNWDELDLRPSGTFVREYLISHCPGVPYFDCAGVEDGEARKDPCGQCSGGTTEIEPCLRAPYDQTPQIIPGILQVENYDLGEEGVTYHDNDAGNQGGWYRIRDGVDIEPIEEGSEDYNIGWLEVGEWLEYTVEIEKTQLYRVTFEGASPDGLGGWKLQQDGQDLSAATTLEMTGGWQAYKTQEHSELIPLDSGTHVIRLVITQSGFNLGSITFEGTNIQAGIHDSKNGHLKVYPNPAKEVIWVADSDVTDTYELYTVAGQLIKSWSGERASQGLSLAGVPAGYYVLSGKTAVTPIIVR